MKRKSAKKQVTTPHISLRKVLAIALTGAAVVYVGKFAGERHQRESSVVEDALYPQTPRLNILEDFGLTLAENFSGSAAVGACRDRDTLAGKQAKEAIDRLNDTRKIGELKEIITEPRGGCGYSYARDAAIDALGRIGDADAANFLYSHLVNLPRDATYGERLLEALNRLDHGLAVKAAVNLYPKRSVNKILTEKPDRNAVRYMVSKGDVLGIAIYVNNGNFIFPEYRRAMADAILNEFDGTNCGNAPDEMYAIGKALRTLSESHANTVLAEYSTSGICGYAWIRNPHLGRAFMAGLRGESW